MCHVRCKYCDQECVAISQDFRTVKFRVKFMEDGSGRALRTTSCVSCYNTEILSTHCAVMSRKSSISLGITNRA